MTTELIDVLFKGQRVIDKEEDSMVRRGYEGTGTGDFNLPPVFKGSIMTEFDDHDSDAQVLADIRELLFIIADNVAGSYKTGGSDARFKRFVAQRMRRPDA